MPLYSYQEQVKRLIQDGKSVILQAPTGAGKTRAALSPFIESFFDSPADAFPRKCIYSVPMRVLANQFLAEYEDLSASYRRKFQRRIDVSIQTGDRPDDPKLESNLIFSTIDQTLSGFLNIPFSLGTSSANINAGALLSSYLIFDELHLYDPDTSLPTTLEMLRMFKGITPFILMTATFSAQMLARLGELLDAVVVPENKQARISMQTIGSQVGKTRCFHPDDSPLTAEAVLKPERYGQRTICICNTVARAQSLYDSIKAQLEDQGDHETIVKLIHSRFYKEDRDQKETWIKQQFGKAQRDYDRPHLILVATQVIEVGLDVTCNIMHTEMAPAAALLQRAGRCARQANENGDVFVYLPRDKDGEPDYAPYYLKSRPRKTQRGLSLCQATWITLNSAEFKGKNMTFDLEQAWIDQVHTPIDQEILYGVRANRHLHTSSILRTMQDRDISSSSELIRDVDSRFVIIHPNPEVDPNLARNPWYYDGFAFSPGTLAAVFKKLGENANSEVPWLMKTAQSISTEAGGQDDETSARVPVEYKWYSLVEPNEVYRSAVLAIHPSVAQYNPETGIELKPGDSSFRLHPRKRNKQRKNFDYERETYAQHIAGLYDAFREGMTDRETGKFRLPISEEIAYTAKRIEERFGIRPDETDQMIRAIFACHDLGKLNEEWQSWAHEWQRQVSRVLGQDVSQPEKVMLAHTDFDASELQKELQRRLGKRPHHAGEGAMAAAGLIATVCGDNLDLGRAAVTTIARHHSAATDEYSPYRCHPAAVEAFAQALAAIGLPQDLGSQVTWSNDGKQALKDVLVSFSRTDIEEVLLYFLLIRVLRLADQRSGHFSK